MATPATTLTLRYEMKMESDSGLTCSDVNWEQAKKEGNPTMSDSGDVIECPSESQYMTDDGQVMQRCVKFLYLNAFPGNRTSIFFNGARLFNEGLSKGFHLSNAVEIPKGTIEVTCQLDGVRAGEEGIDNNEWESGDPGKYGGGKRYESVPGGGGAYIGATPSLDAFSKRGYYTHADDDELSTIGTAIMRTAEETRWTGLKAGFQWQKTSKGRKNHDYNPMYPFDDQGFFTYYMQMGKKEAALGGATEVPTIAPTESPSSSTESPTMAPSIEPTGKPTMTPTPLPTTAPLRDVHPHVITMTDGPYATQWGFNQTKMDNLLDDGTVVFFINTVARNFTKIFNWDNNCTGRYAPEEGSKAWIEREANEKPKWEGENAAGEYRAWNSRRDEAVANESMVPHIFYNRTYVVDRSDHATVCVTNSDTKYMHAIANVSFLDLSMAYFKDGTPSQNYLSGWLTLHALPDIMPTSAPTGVPTPVPTRESPMPTATMTPTTPSPTSLPTPLPYPVPTSAPTTSPVPSANPTPSPSAAPTVTSSPTGTNPTPTPTVSSAPTQEPVDGDPACYGTVLAKEKVYFEPGRIWYVGITGSFSEADEWWEEHSEGNGNNANSHKEKSKRDHGGGPLQGDYGPAGGYYFTRGVNYKFEIIDEYGGPSQAPTMMPTFGETEVYVPSEFIVDPLKAQYENFVLSCVVLFGMSATAFMCTRCAFNALENRDKGRWFF